MLSNLKQGGVPMKAIPVVALVALLMVTPLDACPHCNIHNYLDKSVESSTDVYVGQVISLQGEGAALVKVVEVLRGRRAVGEQVKVELYADKDIIGTRQLFSNPTNHPPSFPTLPLWMKDEVSFLLTKDRLITDPKDA